MKGPRLIGRVSSARPHVLLVTPPGSPLWPSGTTLLARHLAQGALDFHYRLLGTRGQVAPGPFSEVEPIFGAGLKGGLRDQARVMARLMRPDRCSVHHFMFAPHPRALRAIRSTRLLKRSRSVHTIPSQPSGEVDLARLVFADRTVVLSEASALSFRSSGVEQVEVIRPGVPLPKAPLDTMEARGRLELSVPALPMSEAPLFVYAGDLEFSDGARNLIEAAEMMAAQGTEARFVLACRPKTPSAALVLEGLERRVRRVGLEGRVTFLGVVDDMPALLGAATAVVMPVDTLVAKVDIPLVLLEAMALGTPTVVSDLPSLQELAGLGLGTRVVKRRDPAELARTLSHLAESPSTLKRLSRGARQTVKSHFSVDAMVRRYEALYRELGVGLA